MNVTTILLIFLVAAINTFIIVLAIRLIFKVKVNKQKLTSHVKKEVLPVIRRSESSEPKKIPLQEKNNKPEVKEIPEEKMEHSKYLKYTTAGYIIPGKDDKKKKHIWR